MDVFLCIDLPEQQDICDALSFVWRSLSLTAAACEHKYIPEDKQQSARDIFANTFYI